VEKLGLDWIIEKRRLVGQKHTKRAAAKEVTDTVVRVCEPCVNFEIITRLGVDLESDAAIRWVSIDRTIAGQ